MPPISVLGGTFRAAPDHYYTTDYGAVVRVTWITLCARSTPTPQIE